MFVSSVDLLKSSLLPHLHGADVGVAAGAVPAALHGFGIQRRHNAKVFTDAVQQEARDPQMVAHLDAFAGTDLELPLKEHKQGGVRAERKRGGGCSVTTMNERERSRQDVLRWIIFLLGKTLLQHKVSPTFHVNILLFLLSLGPIFFGNLVRKHSHLCDVTKRHSYLSQVGVNSPTQM